MNRYDRQIRLPGIGQAGQQRLAESSVLVVGCGALGSVIAEQVVRAGIGLVRLVDRDIVEWTNLQRQVLFDEADARESLPKVVAAARRLEKINSTIRLEPLFLDLHAGNIEEVAGVDGRGANRRVNLIIDGSDNAEVRYLINDVAVKHGLPWIYGACVGTEGRVMLIRPAADACMRCIYPEIPGVGELATCDTAGVLGPAAGIVGAIEAATAIRYLTGQTAADKQDMVVLDAWANYFRAIDMRAGKREDCPCCGARRYDFLDSPASVAATTLCGRNAVQVRFAARGRPTDFAAAAERLGSAGELETSPYFVRCKLREPEGVSLTLFPDGRLIVSGTSDLARARSISARFVGN